MITVIIPSYNRANTIESSVQSVLSQTISDIELIVVDDCSTDNTKEILSNISDKRLRYICLEKNSGACAARNKGIDEAHGDYIAFQDSDDEWVPDKLEKQINAINEFDVDICTCQKLRYNVNKSKYDVTHENIRSGVLPYSVICKNSTVSTQTILAKKSVLSNIRFDEKVKKAQDYDWSIRAGERYKIYFLAEPLVKQYLQYDSLTMMGKGKVFDREVEMCEYFYGKYESKYENNILLEICMLKRLAYYKALCGKDVSQEILRIYRLKRNSKEYIKYIFAKIRLLNIYFKMDYRRKNRILLEK